MEEGQSVGEELTQQLVAVYCIPIEVAECELTQQLVAVYCIVYL